VIFGGFGGGGPAARDGGQRGEALVVWSEQKKGGAGKSGGDGGGTLLKGCGGEAAEGGPGGEGATHARAGIVVQTGARQPLTRGPQLAAGGRGRGEARGAWAGPREKGEVGRARMNRKVFDLFK
jgi:hypothetical protein